MSSLRASRSWRTPEPEGTAELFARAAGLEARGRDDEAQAAYIEVIRRDGAHFDALLALGNLLNRKGRRRAARLTYLEAAKTSPNDPSLEVNIGNTFLESGELEEARAHFTRALQLDATLPEAHQGMSYVFLRLGDEPAAAAHRDAGFASRAVMKFPYRGEGEPLRALLVVSALGGNVATGEFLDDRTFAVTRIFAEYYAERALPPSDVVFNAVGDADRCGDALRKLEALLADVRSPVVNTPQAVLATRRAFAGDLLGGIQGLRTSKTAVHARSALIALPRASLEGQGFAPPLLLRALGFHTGMFFERAEGWDEVSAIAQRLPGDEIAVLEYLDARGMDGMYRKYRVMLIDGRLYPLHLALSHEWKVHYFTADMAKNETHQALERQFLGDMRSTLGARALDVLTQIAARLHLDYGGIDFALDGDGNLLLFEANATMIVPSRETSPSLAYRVPYLQTAIDAVRDMVMRRAGTKSGESTRS